MNERAGRGLLGVAGLVMWGVLAAAGQGNVVKTRGGAVRGVENANSHVVVFKGIPFAAPPVAELRWRAPQPVKPWSGVRAADTFGAACMQRVHGDFLPWTAEFLTQNKVSEDCLFLNVWTSHVASGKAASGAKMPVVVFIHGGGFSEGAGDIAVYDGARLAETGLVVVTINYRLGVFGFFAHPELTAESEHHSSGNYGLLDQLAALKWVQANIGSFGGDPQRVTIWGQSAGAFSVAGLVASPLGAKLFQRAMADSGIGVAGLPMAKLKDAEDGGEKFATEHHAKSLSELRALKADDLLAGPQGGGGLRFAPIIDGWVLTDTPQKLSESGGDNDVAVITGVQANDGMLFATRIQSVDDYANFAKRLYGAMADEFLQLYAAKSADEAKAMLNESTRDRDRVSMYVWGVRRAKQHRQPVFTYYFDRAIPWPQHPEFGAFHSGELPYFFLNLKTLDRPWEQTDFELAKTAAAYLKNFAATGDPSGNGVPAWPAVQDGAPQTMEIGAKTGPMPLADNKKLDFWMRFFASPAGEHAPPF